jgi:serine O-acetyltransferase
VDGSFDVGAKWDELAKALEDSYFAHKRIHHITSRYLPNRLEVHDLLKELFGLVYPGFFGQQDLSMENIAEHIRQQLKKVGVQLYRQIFRSFSCRGEDNIDLLERKARETTERFLDSLPQVRELLAGDVMAAYTGDPAAQDTDEVVFSYPATIAIGIFRLAHELWELQVPYIPRIMTEYAHSRTGIDIHPGATIGRGFFIDHGTGVVIGETTIIGENCKLYQGVTLGAPSFPFDEHGQIMRNYKRHPTLEDNVIVYSNASILGDVTIGKGATIGGGVFLTRSVPPGCRVSMKAPELTYRNRRSRIDRGYVSDYQI